MRSYMLTMAHGAPTGRLLAHDPATNATEVLQEGLWFANGVALAADESFVAVVETCSMRVRRRWLTGPKQGTLDTLIDSLPGLCSLCMPRRCSLLPRRATCCLFSHYSPFSSHASSSPCCPPLPAICRLAG